MKCQDCTALLEEYSDGELAAGRAAEVAAHLAACAACADLLDELGREQELFLRYEREVEITPALWQGVRAELFAAKPEAGSSPVGRRALAWLAGLLVAPRFSPALTAAMMLAAVGLTVALMKSLDSGNSAPVIAKVEEKGRDRQRVEAASPTPQTPTGVTPSTASGPTDATAVETSTPRPGRDEETAGADRNRRERQPAPTQNAARVENVAVRNDAAVSRGVTPEQLVYEAEQKYLTAIKLLSQDVQRKRPQIEAETLARFDQTLAAIDRTIADTRRAVVKHTGDPVAAQYMLSAYARKVEVLREMAQAETAR